MKKYLFLLGLFILYLFLNFNNKTEPVLSENNRYDNGVSEVTIKFNEEINCNNLEKKFSAYENDYYVKQMVIKDKTINISCNDFKKCIDDVYEEENNIFLINYISNGFSVKEVTFLAYTDEIIPFLNTNNFNYTLY